MAVIVIDTNRRRLETRFPLYRERLMNFIRSAEREGIEKGISIGVLMGQIWLYQELLEQQPTPQADLQAMPLEDLWALRIRLHNKFLPNGE